MAYRDVGLSGAYTLKNGHSGVWHELHKKTPGYAGIKVSGTIRFSRNSGDNKSITISGNVSNSLVGTSPVYDYDIEFGIVKGGNIYNTKNAADTSNRYVVNGELKTSKNLGRPGSASVSDLSFEDETKENNTTYYVCLKCGQTGGCSVGYSGGNHSDWVIVGTLTIDGDMLYQPYKTPTISVSGDIISVHNSQRTIHIKENESGDSTATSVSVEINGKAYSTDIGNGSSDYKFTPSDSGVMDASNYEFKAKRTHSKNSSSASSSKSLYTYRTPKIKDISVSPSSFSGFGNAEVSWNTNTKRWDLDKELEFETYIKLGSGNYIKSDSQNPQGQSQDNVFTLQSQNITKELIDKMFTNTQRSVESISTTLTMKRLNVSSKVYSEGSANVNIQFKPKYKVTNLKFINLKNNLEIAPNSTIYLDECEKIKVTWSYPDYTDRGVVNGYIVRVYGDAGYKNLVTEKQVNTSELSSSVEFTVRTELNRGNMNYITITPYYDTPDAKIANIEGPSEQSIFVLPIGKLHSPKVPYPVNNKKWHNNQFRILCELPEDDDYDVLENEINSDTYRYKDIEIVINDKSYKYTENPNIFSTSTLGYKYRICINPSLLQNFVESSSYNIKIRVLKNYFMDLWSEYVELKLNIESIDNLNLIKGEPILVDSYNYVRTKSTELWEVYPINSLPKDNVERDKYDIIYHNDYNGIYKTILQIQNDVNNWARFDDNRFNVKFNQTINYLSGSDNTKKEIITANKDSRPSIQGRNYMNILIDCMNLLK